MSSSAFPSPVSNSLSEILVHYELPAARMRQAVRAYWYHVLRQMLTPSTLILMALSAAIFARGITLPGRWSWLTVLAGIAAAGLLAVVLAWVVFLPVLLWLGSRQLARLPHHRVTVTLGADSLAFATATERLEVTWSEVKEVLLLPDFIFVHLKSGARLPIPRSGLPDEAMHRLRTETERHGGLLKRS